MSQVKDKMVDAKDTIKDKASEYINLDKTKDTLN
jgi:hypothetical protein